MKTIKLKFEQTQNRTITLVKAVYELDRNGKVKKDSSGKPIIKIPALKEKQECIIEYISPELKFDDDKTNEKIAVEILTLLAESYACAKQSGSTRYTLGNSDFVINGKFILYLNVDGQDYSLDDSGLLFVQNQQIRLSNIKLLAINMLRILQIADNKSPLLAESTFRKALTTKMIELSNTKRLN